MATPPAVTPQQEEAMERKFQHILALLKVSAMPQDVKDSWLALLPEMTVEQVNRFIKLLEKELQQALEAAQNHPEDQRMLDQLKEAMQFHEEEQKNIEERTLAALQAIEDELPSAPATPPPPAATSL